MGRSKLKVALAAHKGTDFQKLKEKKKHKQALKAKTKKGGKEEEDDDEDEEDEDEVKNALIDGEAEESEDEEDEDEDEDEDEVEDEEDGEDDEEDEGETQADLVAAINDSDDSDSEVEMEAKMARAKTAQPAKKGDAAAAAGDDDDDDEDDEDEDEDEELAWSDVDEETRAGLAVRQRPTINNAAALEAARARIRATALGGPLAPADGAAAAAVPFSVHLSVTGTVPTAAGLADVQDDVKRELQLVRQSQEAAVAARAALRREAARAGGAVVPFSRPADYFAEMVKDDGHMAQVRAKLVEAAAAKRAAADARKQRDLKKFGKQVQVARLQERAKAKKETLEKIQSLKRSEFCFYDYFAQPLMEERSDGAPASTHEADLFDVAVDRELAAKPAKKAKTDGGPNAKRQKKNEKYGFGGKKKNAKSGDALSSGDLSGFDAKRMKAGAKPPKAGRGRPGQAATGFRKTRPGKMRRKAAAGKR